MATAILTKSECPSCGSIVTGKDVIQSTKTKHSFGSPARCVNCGYKGELILHSFKQMDLSIYEQTEVALIVPSDKADRIQEIALRELQGVNDENK